MAKFVTFRCPDCQGTFRWLRHPNDAPPPDRCQLCGNWMSEDEPPEEVWVPLAPGIRQSAYAKSVDQVYRQMEQASIERAEDAASMAGVPVSEMSDLKLTNFREPSEMREGDVAAITKASAAAQRLSIGPSAPGFQQLGGPPPNHAPGIADSYTERNALVSNIRSAHTQTASSVTRAGNMGSYRD